MKKSYADICLDRSELLRFTKECYGIGTVMASKSAEDACYITTPELARRLKKACDALKDFSTLYGNPYLKELANELEALPEGKE